MSFKAELLQAIAGKNRGLLATEKDNVKILTAVEKLEDHNPNHDPLNEPELLDGDWRLLYTTSSSLLNLEKLPLAHLGEIYQCVRIDNNKIYNIAEILGLPFLDGLIAVGANFETVSTKRVNVKFNRSIIALQRLVGYLSPQDLIAKIETGKSFPPLDFGIGEQAISNLPFSNIWGRWWKNDNDPAWLEITYLDEDLRIGRGNQGNVFILEKCQR